MSGPGRLPAAGLETPRPVALVVLAILAHLVAAQSITLVPRIITMDFYQYWGVGAVRRMSPEPLGSPYRDPRSYHAVLNRYAANAGHPKLETLSRAVRQPGLTATPFTYLLFTGFPAEYTVAAGVFHVLQVAAFLGGMIVLGVLYGYAPFPLLCLAGLLLLAAGPVSSDLRVGNIGCLQFAALAGCLALALRLGRAARPTAFGAVLLSLVTVLLLVKPNVAPALGMLALHAWFVLGIRRVALAAVPAALAGAVVLVVPSLYFDNWAVWQEWYRSVFGGNPYALAGPPSVGNYSGSKLIANLLGLGLGTVAALLAACLLASMVLVMAWPAAGARRPTPRAMVARVLGDPRLAIAIGVVCAVALPPLAWYHYYVIALIPALWLLAPSPGSWTLAACGFAGLALSVGLPNVLLLPLGWNDAVAGMAALSWLPLWIGILLRLRWAVDEPRAAAAAASDQQRQPEPRRRRPRPAAARP